MKKRNYIYQLLIVSFLLLSIASCRDDEYVLPTEFQTFPPDSTIHENIAGIYVLNEGNMGSNKATIDFLDFRKNMYIKNYYTEKNPNVVKELGDVGNDIQIYGNRLYAVINCSNKVEVMEAYTGRRIGQVNIPNCRYIKFYRGHAYVSSYVGPVGIDPNAQLGAVFKVDTATLKIVDQVNVGYQPDELEVLGDYLYVANSGGYRGGSGDGEYDYTVSVVEMYAMKQIQKIPVGINLHRIRKDKYNRLWVSSRGDYGKTPSRLHLLQRKDKNSKEMVVTDTLNIPCSEMFIQGDSLYFYSTQKSSISGNEEVTASYGIIDIRTKELVSNNFITDGTERFIKVPYGLNIDPYNGDIYVTDAKNYLISGTLHCYTREGKRKETSFFTGDIPAHMTFLYKNPKK